MKKWILMFMCIAFSGLIADAEEYKYGPFNNYEEMEERTAGVVIPMTGEYGFHDPFSGQDYTISSKGGGTYWIKYAVPLFSATYYEFETAEGAAFDPDTDSITLIDVVAKSLDPDHDPCEIPELEGFDPCDPEAVVLSGGAQTGGWYEGFSGTIYHADVCETTLTELGSLMNGHDLSKFTGDPDSIVYVQRAVVPPNDFMPFVFTCEYQGYVEDGDLGWEPPSDANFTHLHSWDVNITQWNPTVATVTDVDLQAPHVYPGSILVYEPEGWGDDTTWVLQLGRVGWQTNPGEPIEQTGPIFGLRLYARTPHVEQGIIVLTENKQIVGGPISTVVPGREALCGDFGYALGDINKDCKVDLTDVAYVAQDWMKCSDPCGAGCVNENIVGVGFAFNGNDSNGPAKILYLYDDLNADVLEPNDTILEYRGTAVSTGQELAAVIETMDDADPGQTISMLIDRNQTQEMISVVTKSMDEGYLQGTVFNAKCVYQFTVKDGEDYCACEPNRDTDWCEQGFNLRSYRSKLAKVSAWCRDSDGNTHGTPVIRPTPDVDRVLILGK